MSASKRSLTIDEAERAGARGPASAASEVSMCPDGPIPGKRDPEARKRAILQAAQDVIATHGIGSVTHRLIAAQAQVALGSTTYYFPSLAELIRQALEDVAARGVAEMKQWGELIAASQDPGGELARLAGQYVADRERALREYDLYLAAAREEDLRPPAKAWFEELDRQLCKVSDSGRASVASLLVDGAMLRALALGQDVDVPMLSRALREVLT